MDIKKSKARQKEMRKFIRVNEAESESKSLIGIEINETRIALEKEVKYCKSLASYLNRTRPRLENFKERDEANLPEDVERRKKNARSQRVAYAVKTRKLPPLPSELRRKRRPLVSRVIRGVVEKGEGHRSRNLRIADFQREKFEKRRKA
jgi:hypothetical protein